MEKKQPTPKQTKFIKLILENIGNKKSTKTLGQMLREVGYSEAICKNPKLIFDSEAVQDGISDFVKMLDDKRRMALTHITNKKLEVSTAKDLSSITDTLNKTHELLSGKPTEITKYTLSKAEQEKIDSLLDN